MHVRFTCLWSETRKDQRACMCECLCARVHVGVFVCVGVCASVIFLGVWVHVIYLHQKFIHTSNQHFCLSSSNKLAVRAMVSLIEV